MRYEVEIMTTGILDNYNYRIFVMLTQEQLMDVKEKVNDRTTDLNDKEFFDKATPDEMMIFIEEHFKEHADRHERRYCKNIKIYELELDKEIREKLWNDKVLSDVWDFVIIPSINCWKQEHNSDIYQMGRSGGWLYMDRAKVHDFSNYEPVRQEDEDQDEYEDRMHPLKGLFEELWYFEKWYNDVFEDVKEYLNDVEIEEDDKG